MDAATRRGMGWDEASALALQPLFRAILAAAPDTLTLTYRSDSSRSKAHPDTRLAVELDGGDGRGWVSALQDASVNVFSYGAFPALWFKGLGLLSVNILALPRVIDVGLVNEVDSMRRATGLEVLATRPGWNTKVSTIEIDDGDLRLEQVIYASRASGCLDDNGRPLTTATYPVLGEDVWSVISAAVVHLHDKGVSNQGMTIWQSTEAKCATPGAQNAFGLDVAGLTADLNLAMIGAQVPAGVWSYVTLGPHLELHQELQLLSYRGAWLLDKSQGYENPVYERPDEDAGHWFVRSVDGLTYKEVTVGDAYFGNTSGNIGGRDRLYEPDQVDPLP